MPHHFDPMCVNGPFDHPGLDVDLVFERRATLLDLGDLGCIAPRKLLRVSDVFITHRYMDHFATFDQLPRRLLGREKVVGLYRPAGLIDTVEHKLEAYSWSLNEGYDGNLAFPVMELDDAGYLTSAQFSGPRRFERVETGSRESDEGLVLRKRGLQVHYDRPWRARARFRARGAASNQHMTQQGRGLETRCRVMDSGLRGGGAPGPTR